MKRLHPLLSPIGFVLIFMMLIGLSLSIWFSGGSAFSPGRLSAKSHSEGVIGGFTSHAEFEKECRRCHQPLRTSQASLCLDCHTKVGDEITSHTGIHGTVQIAQRCGTCHPDHKGRDFDTAKAALAYFDHGSTSFSLVRHQLNYDEAPMDCSTCHTFDPRLSFSTDRCADCHAMHDTVFMVQHVQEFGANCLLCHDGVDRMAHFDHATTAFPLNGKHSQVSCAQCHLQVSDTASLASDLAQSDDPFKNAPRECVQCHAEPPAHRGSFDQNCSLCHTPTGWTPALLDGKPFHHADQTSFSLARHTLDYLGQAITCAGCHPADISSIDVGTCVACHSQHDAAFMRKHQDQFGPNCLECHDGKDSMKDFDHADVFPLEGAHAETECSACHVNNTFKGTPTECAKCHAEPAIHAGFFGLECQDCHSTSAWSPAYLRVHSFPLTHGEQGEISCQVCHPASYVEYTCYGCHDHQPDSIAESHADLGISLAELPGCAKCHPTGVEGEAEPRNQ